MQWLPFGTKSTQFLQRSCYDDAWITILEGSVRSSKTVTMIPKWLSYCLEGPQGLLAITGVSKDTIYDNVLRDLFETVGKQGYSYNRQSGDLTLLGRPIKVIGAKDEGSEKYLRGKTLAGAYVDEGSLMPESFFKQLLNRLSVANAKCYITTNPDSPYHYLHKDYIQSETMRNNGMVDVIHYELDDNPNLDEGYKNNIRNAYAGLFYKRFILGLWVAAEGVIYDSFDPIENSYEKLPFHLDDNTVRKDRFIAIDYGTTNPCVFLDIIDTPTNIYVHDEYYWDSKERQRQKTDAEYADDLERFCKDKRINRVILDPSAASFRAELKKRGFNIKDANNEVLDGIRMTSALFGRRIIKVHARCKNLLRELVSYAWDEKAKLRGEEKPLKTNDHACDALRYYAYSIWNQSRLLMLERYFGKIA